MTKFGTVTQGEAYFWGHSHPDPKCEGPRCPHNLHVHSVRNNQILHGDQTRSDKKFHTVNHEC